MIEDLRIFQLHLVDTRTSPVTLNATLTGLKFFLDITLGRGELMARMQPVKLPRTVPVVLSMQEAAALIAAARNIKHQAALSVAYGAGLRASEVCRLKVMSAIEQCCSAALGGHVLRCEGCATGLVSYDSCRIQCLNPHRVGAIN